MSTLQQLLQSARLGQQPLIMNSNFIEFPAFSIQVHGLCDVPYFVASTRVRVFLAMPDDTSHIKSACDDLALGDKFQLRLFSALHPQGGQRAVEHGNSVHALPIIDTIQADASECCAPWFSGVESFGYVDAKVMTAPELPLKSSVVAVALVDVIDRRTSKSLGCIGGCVIHLFQRNGVMAFPLLRSIHFSTPHVVSFGDEVLPMTSLVVEIHWGPAASNSPNKMTSKKLRALMFGAIDIAEHTMLAPCASAAVSLSREDRRKLLYKNEAYRSMRPIDIQLNNLLARPIFESRDDAHYSHSEMPTDLSVIDSLGFHVFNGKRGASMTVHELRFPEPLPHDTTTALSKLSSVVVPAPSLANLMFFRVVVEANGVVVGTTVHHDWEAPLNNPKFPSQSSTFVLSEETMADDDELEAGKPRSSTKRQTSTSSNSKRGGSSESESSDDDDDEHSNSRTAPPQSVRTSSSFHDLGELQGVNCMVYVFAVIPNYKKLSNTINGAGGGGSRLPLASSASSSLLHRLGYRNFEPLNPSHYQVIPYGWAPLDVVDPMQPFIKNRLREPISLYRGSPTEEVVVALSKLWAKKTGGGDTAGALQLIHQPTLQDVLAHQTLGPKLQTQLVISVADASLVHSSSIVQDDLRPTNRRSGGGEGGGGGSGGSLSLRRSWLGSSPDCTVPQVEECLEATFAAFAFE